MAKKIYPEDLSEKELRDLLMNKRKVERHKRMDAFKKSGRVVELSQSRQFLSMDGIEKEPEDDKDDPLRVIRRRQYKAITNNILLFVEVIAVVALVVILVRGANIVSGLAQEAVSAVLEQPTLAPTPLIMEVVLPAGHYPPDSPGGVRFNDSEIPEHLRPLIPVMADIPIPTPGPETPLRIQIPAINVDAPIVIGDDYESLKAGVGWHIGSADPGENGNLFLSAHNDVWGQIFRHLDQLKPGDEVIVTTSKRAYVYAITKTVVVEPNYVQALGNTPNATISLLSCYPYMVDDQRIIVKGVLQE